MFRSRKYKSGTRNCLWRWTEEVPSEFITRLHLVQVAGYALVVHWIDRPDPEPFFHDHPVSFLSLILSGSYRERRQRMIDGQLTGLVTTRRWFNWFTASPDDRHSIVYVAPGGAITLCFMGPARRHWGYHTDQGWVYWRDYQAAERNAIEQGGSCREHLIPTVTDKHNRHK